MALTPAVAGICGLVVGSFLNVVVHRVPRGESIVSPPSHCPACNTPIGPHDNIPVVSWLVLRGRCRHCRAPISARYPAVEALTAALFVAVALAVDGPERWLGLALVAVLIPAALIDLEHGIVPNALTAVAAVAGLALLVALDPALLPEHLVAAAAGAAAFGALALVLPAAFGMGDAKLVGVMGLYLGREVVVALVVAFLAGAVLGLAILARRGVGKGRRTAVPFAPLLALGGVVAVLVGPEIADWYLDRV